MSAEAKTCAAYIDRPRVCSDFSSDECERGSGEPAYKHLFKSHEDLLGWMQAQRPRAFERYAKKRRELLKERTRRASSPRPRGPREPRARR